MSWNVYNSSGALRTQESVAFGGLSTTLPSSPTDGQIVLYQPPSGAGAVWTLRYNSQSASAYKWEFLGGSELHSYGGGGNVSTGGIAVYADPAGGASTITVPLGGDYLASFGARMVNNSSGNMSTGRLGLNVGGTIYTGVEYKAHTTLNEGQTTSYMIRYTGAAASTVFKVQASTVAGINTNVYSPYLSIRPIRVG